MQPGVLKPAIKVDERFKTATATTVLPLGPSGADHLPALIKEASDQQMKTLVVDYDLKSILPESDARVAPTPACVDVDQKTLRVVYPLTGENSYPEGAHFSKSVCCILWRVHKGRKEVLLVTEKNRDYTSFVAGGMKWREDSVAATKREVKEEVGLELKEETMMWHGSMEFLRNAPFRDLNTLDTFSAEVADAEAAVTLQESEIKAAMWLSVEEAMGKLTIANAKAALRSFDSQQGVPVMKDKYGNWYWIAAAGVPQQAA